MRSDHRADGLTRGEAERRFREMQAAEDGNPTPALAGRYTVDDACTALRRKLEYVGVSRCYAANCERKQRLHIGPAIGDEVLHKVTRRDVERLGEALIAKGLAPKTVRSTLTFLHGVFEHAIDLEWTRDNPVRRAARPRRRRANDAHADLQFLTLEELETVIRAIPNEVVVREPKPFRAGSAGPWPPPPNDVLGPILRVIIRTAAMTGLRQSELLGLRWRDRLVARSVCACVTRTSAANTPGTASPTCRRAGRCRWPIGSSPSSMVGRSGRSGRTTTSSCFAHPVLGTPLDGRKVTKRFQQACRDAGVRVVRVSRPAPPFATRLAASGQPLRSIQEFLGHADSKTTQIYAHYAPSAREVAMVNEAFAIETPMTQMTDRDGQRRLPGL